MDTLALLCKFGPSRWLIQQLFSKRAQGPQLTVGGLNFKNPIGLAAGFDKDARYLQALACLGFGHVEVGTVTPKAQAGNDKPRLFRLPEDQGLINRMGFNNGGLDAMVERLKNRPEGLIVGGNIGKNKITPNEEAVNDYLSCFNALHPYVDYFVINVSSPNTPGLRELQEKEPLRRIIHAVIEASKTKDISRPIFLKIAPDLTEGQLDDILDIAITEGLSGLICTNTTISREGLRTEKVKIDAIGNGGLSGRPVFRHSTEVLQYLSKRKSDELILIGVGGVFTADDAKKKLESGASLVQVYTGFIYEGPSMVGRICYSLSKRKN
jgi:dihydroorotate dehydrogenase